MDVTHETMTVEQVHDGGTIRLRDCHVEHGTLTVEAVEIGEVRR